MRQAALRTGEINFRAADRSEYGLATGRLNIITARVKEWEIEKGFNAGDWKTQAKRALEAKRLSAPKRATEEAKIVDELRRKANAEAARRYRKALSPERKRAIRDRQWKRRKEQRKTWTPEQWTEFRSKRAKYATDRNRRMRA